MTAEGEMVNGGVKEQTHQVFKNLQAILNSEGTSLEKGSEGDCFY